MDKTKLRKAMEKLNQEAGEKLYEFSEEVSKERLKGARESYAREAKEEEVVAIMDTTFRKNGKEGFLFTSERIYGKKLKAGFLQLDSLKYAVRSEGKIQHIVLVYQDETVYEAAGIGETRELEAVLPLLKLLINFEQPGNRPAKKGETFYRYYKRELRRQIEGIIDKYSLRNTQIQLAKGVAPEIVENLIEKCNAGITFEEVIAVHNSGLENGKMGALFTETAFYSCYGSEEKIPVFYDGLELIVPSGSSSLLVYENGYVYNWMSLNVTDMKEDLKILQEIVNAFRNIQRQFSTEKNLNSVKGWEEFISRRSKGAPDVYKNSVFVSSTFKDMHFERDMIHEKVLPALNKTALEYGQTVSFCDLRWGVNTGDLDSEEGSKKVLSVCLNEIERCKPYMIVILGERYGWIPEEKTIRNAVEERRDFQLDELEKSVTALEIEFGALNGRDQLNRTFFYFREIKGNPSDIYHSEDQKHAEKLARLKDRIGKLAGKQVKCYTVSWDEKSSRLTGLEDFAQMVIHDVQGAMEEAWQAQAVKTPFQKELEMHWELAEKKALQCSARDRMILDCLKQLELGVHFLGITGESGSGKSTVMGCLAQVLCLSGAQVLPVFCGYTAKTDTAAGVVQTVVHFFEELLGEENGSQKSLSSEKEWINEMNLLAERYSKTKERPAVIVIDAADQLQAGEMRDKLKFVPAQLTEKVSVVLSCIEDFPLPYNVFVLHLALMQPEERLEVIQGILRIHRRELEKNVMEAIAQKAFSDHPLYMSLLIQRLLMMNKNDFDEIVARGDGIHAITEHQLKLIEDSSDTLHGICKELLHGAAGRIGGGFVEKSVEYLALSRHGLRESDLQGILEGEGIVWNQLDFSLFINYMRSMFQIRNDGRFDFSHKSFREGIRGDVEETKKLHENIWKWLSRLPEKDEVRRQEAIYHGIMACKHAELVCEIQKQAKNEEFLKMAAKEFAMYSKTDEGQWVADSLRNVSDIGADYLEFLAYRLNSELSNFEEEGLIKETIFLAAFPVAESLAKTHPTAENRRNVSVLEHRLGRIYQGRSTAQDYAKALRHFENALEISEELEKENSTADGKRDLSVDYRMLGSLCLRMAGDKKHDEASAYFAASIRFAEEAVAELPGIENRNHLGWSYQRMAEMYSDDKNYEKVLEYYEQCIAIREKIVKENPSVSFRRQLCSVYNDAAFLYRSYENAENDLKALDFFEKQMPLREAIAEEETDTENLWQLSILYDNIADSYRWTDEAANKEKALGYYEKAIPLLKRVYEETQGDHAKWRLAKACKYASKYSFEQGNASARTRAGEWLQTALKLYEELAEAEDTENAYLDFSDALLLYNRYFSGTKSGVGCMERYLSVMEMLYERTHKKQYKDDMKTAKKMMNLRKLFRI